MEGGGGGGGEGSANVQQRLRGVEDTLTRLGQLCVPLPLFFGPSSTTVQYLAVCVLLFHPLLYYIPPASVPSPEEKDRGGYLERLQEKGVGGSTRRWWRQQTASVADGGTAPRAAGWLDLRPPPHIIK